MGQINVLKNVGGIEGLCVIEPAVHGDSRGYFTETYNKRDMAEAGLDIDFVLDNRPLGKLDKYTHGPILDKLLYLQHYTSRL